MKLYHGTSDAFLASILQHGILPRGKGGGNWQETVPSNGAAVYLTTAYALHFAAQAAANFSGDLLLLEIEADLLPGANFAPDEDYLAQLERAAGRHPAGTSLADRTEYYSHSAQLFRDQWLDSLRGLGTCAYYGDIPPAAISRYAIVGARSQLRLESDPTITLSNYRLLGGYYRQLTARAFGDPVDISDGHQIMRDRVHAICALPRAGVAVVDRMSGDAVVEPG